MQPRELNINFTDNPEEEITLIRKEFKLSGLAETLGKIIDTGEALDPEERMNVAVVIANLQEMFSLELPRVEGTVERTLRLSSRDINLSRILRERGIIRLYRLLREKDQGIPIFQTLINPYDDTPFSRQEDFITWIALEGHMPRSTLFMRFGTYDKMLSLGFSLEESFTTVITKPYAMRKVLNMLGTWNHHKELISVDPTAINRIAQRVLPFEKAQEINSLVTAYEEDPSDATLQTLATKSKPALREFISELAEHPNTKEMMDFVHHDIIGKPEIGYKWRNDALIVMLTQKTVDETGTEVEVSIEEIPFVPDIPYELPEAIVSDLLTRLPIKNRREVLARRKAQERREKEAKDTPLLF